MTHNATVAELLTYSHSQSLAELRERIEEMPDKDQQGIANCAEQLRQVLHMNFAFADVALLMVHYEYMARVEALLYDDSDDSVTLN